ncbi:hypothetical protein vBVpaMR16F_10 [Vibrio phage vB_VpaM_R16F]|nr:hypothetical protein vBVpaMR16F_10 [Vibrio phage vB_VpaM_R16F]
MDIVKQKIMRNCRYENIQECNILIVKQAVKENKHGDQWLIVYWYYVEDLTDDLVVEKIALPLWGTKLERKHLDDINLI